MFEHPHFLWKDFFQRSSFIQTDPVTTALRKNILFQKLTVSELTYLSQLVYERIYRPGELIFSQNERGFGMYLVAQGKVEVRSASSEGEILLTQLSEGSFFGEIALIESHSIRTASVLAVERSVIIGFFKPDLERLLNTKPEAGVKILSQLSAVLARRLIETNKRLSELTEKINAQD